VSGDPRLQIQVVLSSMFMQNTLVVNLRSRSDCLIVDPGLEPQKILKLVDSQGLNPVAVLLTHGHADHIAGNEDMIRRWPEIPLIIGQGDAPMLTDPVLNLSGLAGTPITSPPADQLVKEGDSLRLAGITFDVLDIPGHSPGHVVYVVKQFSPYVVIGGDVLFQGSIGRTDFPGGNFKQLITGIREKLFALPDDTIVYPGHGEPTTVGEEKRSNPYCGERAGLYDLS